MATVKPRLKSTARPGRKGRFNKCGPSVLASNACPKTKIPQEVEFLRAVESGDCPSVRRMLTDDPGLNVNCTDLMGRTPLRIAVQNESEEIVELLLDKAGMRNMYESLLHAISLDHDQIALIILRHPLYTRLESETRLYGNDSMLLATGNDDSLFASETTPLILAAQRNSYEVVSLLLKRGAKIEEPHNNSCDCTRCKNMRDYDELRFAKSRLDAYKGLSSEAYISLSSSDPILCAFNTRQSILRVATMERHYKNTYDLLQAQLSTYVVRLLHSVRGDEELDIILNEGAVNEDEVLARLQLAIRYNEKKFVAHCACQKKLTTMWGGSTQHHIIRGRSWVRPIMFMAISLSLPFLVLLYLIAPASKIGTFLRTPVVRFLGQTASFFVFLALIMAFSFTCTPSRPPNHPSVVYTIDHLHSAKANLTAAGIGYSTHVRDFSPTNLQVVLQVFLIGMLWQECKQLYNSSYKDYIASVFNILDSLSLSIYIASFALRYISYWKTLVSLEYFSRWPGVAALIRQEPEAEYRYYWLFADRYYWDAVDPLVVSEGLFAVANVLSFSRLFYILAPNEHLGPLQISLGRVLTDICKFTMIFLIVFIAFLVGLQNLYWYYNPSVRKPIEMTHLHESLTTEAEKAFGTFGYTMKTVFWALFGMGSPDVVELGQGYHGGFTERVGDIVFGSYHIAAVIVLLNMVIAMMAQSFHAIQADEDTEWKFSRAKLYMEFIRRAPTLPVPFNIIPSPKSIYGACVALSSCIRRRPPKTQALRNNELNTAATTENESNGHPHVSNEQNSIASSIASQTRSTVRDEESGSEAAIKKIKYVGKKLYCNHKQDSGVETPEKPSYEMVMKRIVKRYIFESQQVDTSPLEGDIDDLKQDLSSVRFELSNALETQTETIIKSVKYISAKLDLYMSLQNPTLIEKSSLRKSKHRIRPFVGSYKKKVGQKALVLKGKVHEKHSNSKRTPSGVRPDMFCENRVDPAYPENETGWEDSVEEEIVAHHIGYDHTGTASSGDVRSLTDQPQVSAIREERRLKSNASGGLEGAETLTLKEIDVDSMSG